MSKKCAKCLKAVYPLEELKCLDKVWHKGCFKCEVCAMTLNMKNYKGYDKLPYCSAHYPKTTFTQVADTPEIRRIAENTRLQSNVQYHSEFEKSKDKYTVVADNPDIQRCLQNSKNVSLIQYHSEFEKGKSNYTVIADRPDVQCCLEASKNASLVQYHSDFEKMKGNYIPVPDNPELLRHLQNTKNISLVQYHSDFERAKGSCISVPDTLEMKRHTKNTENTSLIKYHDDFEKSKGTYTAIPDSLDMKRSLENTKNISLIKYHEEFEKLKGKKTNVTNDPEMLRLTVNTRMQSNIAYKGLHNQLDKMEQKRPAQTASVENGSTRRIGSIADYDPLSEQYGSLVQGKDSTQQGAAAGRQAGAGDRGMVCRAIYDYTAADSDEVSFLEDDLIIRCNPIDVGWMDGTVERTGQTGMLPSNYVHKVEM